MERLSRLASICLTPNPDLDALTAAADIVREELGAEECYVVRAGDPDFVRLDCGASDPRDYEIKQKGYWLIWRDIATHPEMPVAIAQVENRLVVSGEPMTVGARGSHLAAILPVRESNSEMVIVRGPWPEGITDEQKYFIHIARPMLGLLVGGYLDLQSSRQEREHLKGLAEIARAFSEASGTPEVLTSVATALASASGADWALITLYGGPAGEVVERAMNHARHSSTETAGMALDGRVGEMLERDGASFAREANRTGRPKLIPDVFAPDAGFSDEMRAYYERAHVLSTGAFPLRFAGKALGTVTFSSTTRCNFGPEDVEFLSALVDQAAATINGIRLYRELERSQAELRQQAEKLAEVSRVEHFLARTDTLTGIPNRRYLEEVLEAECARATRYERPLGVIMLDVDYFKEVNDRYGHFCGDEALKFIASLARKACRKADFIARWGGDEFVFVLPETCLSDARAFAERFRELLNESPFRPDAPSEPAFMTASFGVVEGLGAAETATGLLKRADRLLYVAKSQGRNSVAAAPEARRAVA